MIMHAYSVFTVELYPLTVSREAANFVPQPSTGQKVGALCMS